jgi:anti-sigma factor ChrR (cupin superfamily)
MKRHVSDTDLALYASGDLRLWQRIAARLHLQQCESCRDLVREFRADARALRDKAAAMPEGLDWARLSAEMTANIRVGLAAGECVAPRRKTIARSFVPAAWRPLALASLATVVLAAILGGAWWLNVPAQDTQTVARALKSIWHGRRIAPEERGTVIEASPEGIELRKDGGSLGVSQDAAQLMTVSVSTQGSASAHYVDQDTGQVTVTSVYAQ